MKRVPQRSEAGTHRVTGRSVLAGLIAFLTVTGLLSSQRLVSMAERREFSSTQEQLVAAARSLDSVAHTLLLDRPAAFLDRALHGEPDETVILGELVATPATTIRAVTPSSTQPETSTTALTPPSDDDDASNAPLETTTTQPPATTTTVAPPPPLRIISEQAPLLIWSGGDSLGEYVGSQLLYKVADPLLSRVALDYHISTGMTRPDYFDWPASLTATMTGADSRPANDHGPDEQATGGVTTDAEGLESQEPEVENPEITAAPLPRPEAIVFMVGGNDDQPMRIGETKLETNSTEWLSEYRARVGLMMDTAAYQGVRFYWIGLPPMQDERRQSIAVNVNVIIAQEAEVRPWVTYINIVPLLLNPDGAYDRYITGPDGKSIKARSNDGVHVTSSASRWISEIVWGQILQDWNIDLPDQQVSSD